MLPKTILLSAMLLLAACDSNTSLSIPSTDSTEQPQALLNDPAQDGLTTTTSGLQYEVLRSAEGPKPTKDSIVTVHYLGTLTDGTEFDSSYARGQPATFALARTIKGWVEGVQLMSVGSKFRFIIPAHLAYGDRGTGSIIKSGDTLIFEIELLEINSN